MEQAIAAESDSRHDGRLDEAQALCLFAGAGSIFCGDRLLTTPNPSFDTGMEMLGDLGLDRQPSPRERAAELES